MSTTTAEVINKTSPGAAAVVAALATIDALVRKHTAFNGLEDMMAAKGGYRPTIYTDQSELLLVAYAYDTAMELAGDPRRAYRVQASTSTARRHG